MINVDQLGTGPEGKTKRIYFILFKMINIRSDREEKISTTQKRSTEGAENEVKILGSD